MSTNKKQALPGRQQQGAGHASVTPHGLGGGWQCGQCTVKDDADILKMPLFGLLSTEIKY